MMNANVHESTRSHQNIHYKWEQLVDFKYAHTRSVIFAYVHTQQIAYTTTLGMIGSELCIDYTVYKCKNTKYI